MQKLESKEEKLRAKVSKAKDDKASAELKEIDSKKADLLLLFKAYESRQYTKWVQQYIQVRFLSWLIIIIIISYCCLSSVQLLETQATYHNTTLSMLSSLQPAWTAAQDKKPEEIPADTWTAYVQNPEARQPKCENLNFNHRLF